MKKAACIFSVLCFLLLFAGCSQKNDDVLHVGLNATIVEIDASNHVLYVSDCGDANVLGGRCAIDCKELIEDRAIIYVDYETQDISVIRFEELAVGDAVTVNAYEKYLKDAFDRSIRAEQIQLATQRLKQG